MDYLNYGDNTRTSDIPFVEPVPGCKYNVGMTWGNIIIPLKKTSMSNFLTKSRDYLDNIGHLFDGIGKRISLNLISVSQWSRIIHGDNGRGDGHLTMGTKHHDII